MRSIFSKILAIIALVSALSLSSCSIPPSGPPTLDDIYGEWASTDGKVDMRAFIAEDHIEIYLYFDTRVGLYWLGTFPLPNKLKNEFVVVSDGDTEKHLRSMFASMLHQKEFLYRDGKLHFDYSILGVDHVVVLERDER